MKICFTLLVLFYLASFYLLNNDKLQPYKRKCSIKKTKETLKNLCDLYREDKMVIGNLCHSICDRHNNLGYFDHYKLVGCFNSDLNHAFEKDDYEFKTVLVYEIVNTKYVSNKMPERLVLKSTHKYYVDFERHSNLDFDPKSIKEGINFLVEFIRLTLYQNYGIETDPALTHWLDQYLKNNITINDTNSKNIKDIFHYVRLLSGDSYNEFISALKNDNAEDMTRFIDNLGALLNQEEYLFTRYFGNKKHTLNIYGTCGHFYAVEFAESLGSQISLMNFNTKMQTASKFIELIQSFDTNYLSNGIAIKDSKINYRALQICDVKIDNFGLTSKGELKIIDTDMVHPDSYLFTPKICDKHDDCHFFDCFSYCNFKTNKCNLNRINDNLQSICDKIFYNKYFKEDALIGEYDEDGGKLKLFLRKCADPGNFIGTNIKIKVDNDTSLKINKQIENIINSIKNKNTIYDAINI